MPNRILGAVLLAAFIAAMLLLFLCQGALSGFPVDYFLVAAFILPILLIVLSFASMGLYFLGPDGSGAVFGVMLAHIIGFTAMLAVALRLLPQNLSILPFALVSAAVLLLAFSMLWRPKEEKNEKKPGILSLAPIAGFVIMLVALAYVVGKDSADVYASIRGTVAFMLLMPSLVPLFLVFASIWKMVKEDSFTHVSDPQIYFPYILYLVIAIMGLLLGASSFFVSHTA